MNTPFMPTKPNALEGLLIKTPSVDQASALALFFTKTIEDNFTYFPKTARDFYQQAWTSPFLETRLKNPQGLLTCAWHQEKLIGLISGAQPEGGVGTIIWLMVDAAYQNKNVGRELLNRAKNYYRTIDAHKIRLTVHDKKAMKFYLREGFEQEALHKKHWWQIDFFSMVYFI